MYTPSLIPHLTALLALALGTSLAAGAAGAQGMPRIQPNVVFIL